MTSNDAARAYLLVFGRYGATEFIHSDLGPAFVSEMIKNITILLNSKQSLSISMRHESNAIIERCNIEVIRHTRALILALRKNTEWSVYIPLIQRIINATKDVKKNVSPAQLLYGNMVRLDRGLIYPFKLKCSTTSRDYMYQLLENQADLIRAFQLYIANLSDNKKKKQLTNVYQYHIGDYVLMYKDCLSKSKLDTNWY